MLASAIISSLEMSSCCCLTLSNSTINRLQRKITKIKMKKNGKKEKFSLQSNEMNPTCHFFPRENSLVVRVELPQVVVHLFLLLQFDRLQDLHSRLSLHNKKRCQKWWKPMEAMEIGIWKTCLTESLVPFNVLAYRVIKPCSSSLWEKRGNLPFKIEARKKTTP